MVHEEQGVEVIGIVSTVLMVVVGLVIGISPMLVHLGMLISLSFLKLAGQTLFLQSLNYSGMQNPLFYSKLCNKLRNWFFGCLDRQGWVIWTT
mgnify:CR=1 FL=1